MYYIHALEKKLAKEAKKKYLPLQAGDVPDTYADVSDLEREFSYKPKPQTRIEDGISHFVDWYRRYYD